MPRSTRSEVSLVHGKRHRRRCGAVGTCIPIPPRGGPATSRRPPAAGSVKDSHVLHVGAAAAETDADHRRCQRSTTWRSSNTPCTSVVNVVAGCRPQVVGMRSWRDDGPSELISDCSCPWSSAEVCWPADVVLEGASGDVVCTLVPRVEPVERGVLGSTGLLPSSTWTCVHDVTPAPPPDSGLGPTGRLAEGRNPSGRRPDAPACPLTVIHEPVMGANLPAVGPSPVWQGGLGGNADRAAQS